jgi:hypothetical protein
MALGQRQLMSLLLIVFDTKYLHKIKQDGDKLSFEKGKNLIFLGRQQSINRSLVLILAAAILAVALGNMGVARGVPPCCAVGGSDGWSGADLLNNIGSTYSNNTQ